MSITAANAVITLAVTGVFNAPQQLIKFSTDDIYDVDPIDVAETAMGVDGYLTGGRINVPVTQSYTLMADSDSIAVFDAWVAAQNAAGDIYKAQGTTTLKSTGRKYVMSNGILKTYPPLPSAGKTLKPVKYTIVWESALPAPV